VYLLIIDTLPYWRIMMSKIMNQDNMKELAAELAKGLKTPEDLSTFSAQLTKITIEAALNSEMERHQKNGRCRFITRSRQ
jgi:hypothetical protein